MTAREKLEIEHPEDISTTLSCGAIKCPHHYGYLPKPSYCHDATISVEKRCNNCWDREIPEKEKYETLSQDGSEGSLGEPHILDSGDRTEFESGAVRDMRKGKGRCDLLPLDVVSTYLDTALDRIIDGDTHCIFTEFYNFQESGDVNCLYRALDFANPFNNIFTMILEVAKHFEEGALKYGDNNWRKGIPVRCYIDSAIRHYLKFRRGDKDEPHDRAFCWNILCAIWTCKHHPELNEYRKEETHEKED